MGQVLQAKKMNGPSWFVGLNFPVHYPCVRSTYLSMFQRALADALFAHSHGLPLLPSGWPIEAGGSMVVTVKLWLTVKPRS